MLQRWILLGNICNKRITAYLPIHVSKSWWIVSRLEVNHTMMKIIEFSAVANSWKVLNDEQTQNALARQIQGKEKRTMQLTLCAKARTLKGSIKNRTHNQPPLSPRLSVTSTAREWIDESPSRQDRGLVLGLSYSKF